MPKAMWNGKIIAESQNTIELEGNHYFPPDSVQTEYLEKSGNTYECPWKGHADYYNVLVEGETAEDGAWMYPEPSEAANQIKGHFAFWKDVVVTG